MIDYYTKHQGRFEFKTDPQNDLLIGPDGCHYENERKAMYYDQLHFCGCGDPYSMHAFVIECLSEFDRDKHGFGHGTGIDRLVTIVTEKPELAADFIAYVLDHLHLTEHGGSIGGSWLTERGKQFIEIGPMTEDDDRDD